MNGQELESSPIWQEVAPSLTTQAMLRKRKMVHQMGFDRF